jgi:hypothetical protein
MSRLEALEQIRDEMSEALAYGLGGPEPERDEAIRHVGMPFREMVATLLRLRRGHDARWSTTPEMYARGITSSDVPALLQGAGNRLLRKAYESYSGGLLRFCGRIESRDFRDVKAIEVDGDIVLQEVRDGAAFTEGYVKASAETYPISVFGRTFGLSRVLFASDDLEAFANLNARLGTAAAEFVSAKLAALLESNPTMSDSVAVFHASHSNMGTAGALSETTLAELLKLVRSQKGLGGQSIAVVPKALVVPAALEWTARKLLWLLGPQAPIEVVVEPRLTSLTAFYVLATPETVAAVQYTYPAGSGGPTIELGRDPDFDGLRAKVALDFGCGFTDFRGAAKNVGA